MLNDVEFREVHEVAKVDKVKIVACDGKSGFTASQILLAIAIKIIMKQTDMCFEGQRSY
jgi:hypothetical protein